MVPHTLDGGTSLALVGAGLSSSLRLLINVSVNNVAIGTGTGTTKQQAKEQAAQQAYGVLFGNPL